MLDVDAVVAIVLFALSVFALIDCVTTAHPRHLPKQAWILLLLATPEIGWVLWFVAGKERTGTPATAGAVETLKALPLSLRKAPQTAPDDDPVFLKSLEKRPPEHE